MGGVFADQGFHGAPITGQKNVTTAGTAVQITTTNTGIHTVVVRAKIANTGKIYVGASTVSSTTGLELGPGDAITVTTGNLANIYLDCSVSGEGVTYLAT